MLKQLVFSSYLDLKILVLQSDGGTNMSVNPHNLHILYFKQYYSQERCH